MSSSSVAPPLQQPKAEQATPRLTWSLNGSKQQADDEQLPAAETDSPSGAGQRLSVADTHLSQCCNAGNGTAPGHAATSPAAKPTAGLPPAAASAPVDTNPVTDTMLSLACKSSSAGAAAAAAAATKAAVPPLRLPTALPCQAAAAAAPPSQPARTSYQLSDSRRSTHCEYPSLVNEGSAATPYPAAAATAAAPATAAAEQPWTQNTARALRRTQQEVAELCAAGGLPLPVERPYCFDLVGTRKAGFGTSSSSRPIFSSSGCRYDSSDDSSAAPSHSHPDAATWSNCTTPVAVTASAAAAGPPQQHVQRTQEETPGPILLQTKSRSSHAAAAGQPLGGGKRLSQQQQQQQQQQRNLAAGGAQRTHSNQRHHSSCKSSSMMLARPLNGTAAAAIPARQPARCCSPNRCLSSHQAGVKSPGPLSVLERVDQSLALHAELQQQPFWSAGGVAGAAADGKAVQVAAADMVGMASLPCCWWEAQERPLHDPLLLCLPVWVREALELELMEV